MRIVPQNIHVRRFLIGLLLVILAFALLEIFNTSADAVTSKNNTKTESGLSVMEQAKKKFTPPTTTTTTTTLPPTTTTTTTTKIKPYIAPTTTKPYVAPPTSVGDEIYMRLSACESGNPTYNGPSGYDGAFQFSPATWRSMNTGYAFAYEAPFEVQLDAAKRLIARSGWGQFPSCARQLGML
jgi:hypothetical protein